MKRACFTAVLLISVVQSFAHADAIYWTTGFGQTLERANLDATEHVIVTTTGNVNRAIALDVHSGFAYWTGVQGRGISRARLDGSGPEYLIGPAGDPEGIALDLEAGKMYWAESLPIPRIQRANLDGSGQETLVEIGQLGPSGLALDPPNGHIYWSDPWGGGIYRFNLDGTGDIELAVDCPDPTGIALDIAGGLIYWAQNGTGNESIRRASLDGSNIEDLVTPADIAFDNPLGVALDLNAGKLYWADRQLQGIRRANLDGSNVEDFMNLAHRPLFIALDVPIPEPAAGLLLAVGTLALLRPKR